MWVFDATPLIHLASVERLDTIEHLDEHCVTPEPVYSEVVTTGIDRGHPDARRVERCVENGVLEVVSTPETSLGSRLRDNPNLSDADAAVLSCAADRDGTAVVDEAYGRDVATTEGVPTRGTAFLVLSVTKRGVLAPEEARATIDGMIEEGWYCAPDLYAKLLGKLDSIAD
ncbi:DUF3368 domain-containing protein [Halorarum halobium]|uniref:DUF3368 domain-containing protein n=1 Tax=Halorarum halobium TaxID=3075121 RepID=UPI0028A8A723|nr:DUF3368 domain-containing protein [Halobaculum sp. XH14]